MLYGHAHRKKVPHANSLLNYSRRRIFERNRCDLKAAEPRISGMFEVRPTNRACRFRQIDEDASISTGGYGLACAQIPPHRQGTECFNKLLDLLASQLELPPALRARRRPQTAALVPEVSSAHARYRGHLLTSADATPVHEADATANGTSRHRTRR
jgi:hypothetical protein